MNNFRNILEECGLSDLGYRGFLFTFSNCREGANEVRARLERAVADNRWRSLFPRALVSHYHLLASDHQLLMLDTEGSYFKRRKKLFRFEAMWLDHPDFERVMTNFSDSGSDPHLSWQRKLKECGRVLRDWNSNKYENVQRRIKELKRNLEEIKCAERNETNKEEEERILKNWIVGWLERRRCGSKDQ
ncbi:hypothetical protein QQ045_024926 [Rhodiola kirilowii]